MALLSLQDISISFGGPPLLDKINLQIEKGERVCILGRNGEGKTTLLKLIGGVIDPDSGAISIQKGKSIAGLAQELPADLTGTIHDVIAGGLSDVEALLSDYNRLSSSLSQNQDDAILQKLAIIQEKLDRLNGWDITRQVDEAISILSLDGNARFESLSVGFKRRTLLARALVTKPDILLLDEPTNHLDLAAITWMEEFLEKYAGTVILVTHDRMFLQKLATRIIEIDRGSILNWACGYDDFLKRRQEVLDAEEIHRKQFNRKLLKEEEWIRKGIKARRTRNEGRVRALKNMREQQRGWRIKSGTSKITIQDASKSGKIVIEASEITQSYDDKTVINCFSTKIIRGDRIGVIGPNGIGKSTLLKILLGEIEPDKGVIKNGTKLETNYFDQLREQLNEDATVEENIADGRDTVQINGVAKHVIGYLKDFLFSPDRARSPVRILSGGERNRLLLAKLFTRASNLLVLDEPTNDLDMETLELLEEHLLDYQGTILLVSHDRAFLNNVVTSTIVFEENGSIEEYPGGFDDWMIQRRTPEQKKGALKGTLSKKQSKKIVHLPKLTFKEKQELEKLPLVIENLEKEQKDLYEGMADPDFYKNSRETIAKAKTRVDELKLEINSALERWERLESIKEAGS